jgi:hypothetical protein
MFSCGREHNSARHLLPKAWQKYIFPVTSKMDNAQVRNLVEGLYIVKLCYNNNNLK